jgi:hypothetical protein
MTSKPSLFTKMRDALVAVGRSERTAARKARRLEAAPFADFVRLTPEQNVKLGLSRKARHYVLKDVKRVTKATPAISARQYETKKARELFGLSPEQATEARRHGAIRYVSADQRERVAKAAITREETRVIAEIRKLRASGAHVPELIAPALESPSGWVRDQAFVVASTLPGANIGSTAILFAVLIALASRSTEMFASTIRLVFNKNEHLSLV